MDNKWVLCDTGPFGNHAFELCPGSTPRTVDVTAGGHVVYRCGEARIRRTRPIFPSPSSETYFLRIRLARKVVLLVPQQLRQRASISGTARGRDQATKAPANAATAPQTQKI